MLQTIAPQKIRAQSCTLSITRPQGCWWQESGQRFRLSLHDMQFVICKLLN